MTAALFFFLLIGPAFAQTDFQPGATPMPDPPVKMTKATCTTVDLAPQMGPVKNQTKATCYSYTAIELMGFGLPTQYSALHLAIISGGKTKEEKGNPLSGVKGLNGGQIQAAIIRGMNEGLCPEKLVPSTEKDIEDHYRKIMAQYDEAISLRKQIDVQCQEDLVDHLEAPVQKLLGIMLLAEEAKAQSWQSKNLQKELQKAYPRLSLSQINGIYRGTTDKNAFLKELVSQSCRDQLALALPPRKKPENVTKHSCFTRTDAKEQFLQEERGPLMDKINGALQSGRPAGISYIAGGLIQEVSEERNYHSSAVAGRNWLPEKRDKKGQITQRAGCYYLVKNSWGEDWKAPKEAKARSSARYPGYFVASEKELMEHLYSVTTID